MTSSLLRFLLPLAITDLIIQFGAQLLNGGMARMPGATVTLAVYGLAWGIVSFLTATLSEVRQLGLTLVESHADLRMVRRIVYGISVVMTLLLGAIAFTPIGIRVVEGLHGVDPTLGVAVREAIGWLVPTPILFGVTRLNSGLLMRVRQTKSVTYATIASIAITLLVLLAFLPAEFVTKKPILLPVAVTYAGALAELGVMFYGYRRHFLPTLDRLEPADRHSAPRTLTLSYTLRFFWPLALIMAVQGVSRPLINLFVARASDGPEALAALTIVYALAHLPYTWLNHIKNVVPAFREEADSLRHIWRFTLVCGLVSFGSMLVLFWTPISSFLLESYIGVDPALAAHCVVPLMIFSFFPLIVAVRSYYHGIALIEHRTAAMALSGPARAAAIVIGMLVLSLFPMESAARGIAALFLGFLAEAIFVWWGVTRRRLQQGIRSTQTG